MEFGGSCLRAACLIGSGSFVLVSTDVIPSRHRLVSSVMMPQAENMKGSIRAGCQPAGDPSVPMPSQSCSQGHDSKTVCQKVLHSPDRPGFVPFLHVLAGPWVHLLDSQTSSHLKLAGPEGDGAAWPLWQRRDAASVCFMHLSAGTGVPVKQIYIFSYNALLVRRKSWRRSDVHGIHTPLYRITPTLFVPTG